ncbi:adenosylcobinamide amidohydrolase [Halostagnicola larsenii XH-48]|uniref:Adenosylcobinamide amidohydrolase n=1 Tax=Halostagnicola larsenii XH-48 TaxID=797299 RepID=W0JN82_9EURY|nr:adenosylcobinamide amidohydrolase [Halostagnicola larsenii]AHG00054.1 adenosylcobinamide amidohydrolase [Halostagnicola larsenii XH-48]
MTESDEFPEASAFETTRRDGVVRLHRNGTEWLSSGANGGRWETDAAYNLSVPDGWPRTDLETYVADRLERAGFGERGPALLTGVDVADARGARCGSVTVVVTAGLSNPAALPMEPQGGTLPDGDLESASEPGEPVGTVNILVGTTRSLSAGALANLLTVAAEAKAATLLETTGFPGTTSDAVVVGHDPSGRRSEFSGTATAVGAATRACVRDALLGALRAHYDGSEFEGSGDLETTEEAELEATDEAEREDTADAQLAETVDAEIGSVVGVPASLEEAEYGLSTDIAAEVFRLE